MLAERESVLDRLLAGEFNPKILEKLPLTPTERRLTTALFRGQSVVAYAKETGISIHTVRWYVKNIHQKTGVKCQTELFRLLLLSHGNHGQASL
jgi:DNA-binding NarL/FixJ family response regulator